MEAGIASECELQAAYAIGVAEPVSLLVTTFGTGKVSEDKLTSWVLDNFDLRPSGMIEHLNLRRPIYRDSASFGAFGRMDVKLPWEEVNQNLVESLRKLV